MKLTILIILCVFKITEINAQTKSSKKNIETEIFKFYSQLFKIYESDTLETPNYLDLRNQRLDSLFIKNCKPNLRKKAITLINNGYGNDLFTNDYIGDSNINLKVSKVKGKLKVFKVSFDAIYNDAPLNLRIKHINIEITADLVNNKLIITQVN